jgi:hypothetical protein
MGSGRRCRPEEASSASYYARGSGVRPD